MIVNKLFQATSQFLTLAACEWTIPMDCFTRLSHPSGKYCRNNHTSQSSPWKHCWTFLHHRVSCRDSWLLDHLMSWYSSSSGFCPRSVAPQEFWQCEACFLTCPLHTFSRCNQNPGPPSSGVIMYCLISFPCVVFLSYLWILGLFYFMCNALARLETCYGSSSQDFCKKCPIPKSKDRWYPISNATIFVPVFCFTSVQLHAK